MVLANQQTQREQTMTSTFRRGALGYGLDHIAADLSRAGYKRDSVKLYLARIARFSAYAVGCGWSKSRPIPREIFDRYLRARPTTAARWAAQMAIGCAPPCCPERFAATPSQNKLDRDDPLLAAYSQRRVRRSF
jgi:hypothetical protein